MEDWFDTLESYKPIGDSDLKEIIRENPNIKLIDKDSKLIGLEFNIENLDFSQNSIQTTSDDEIKFVKIDSFENINIFKNDDLYLIIKDEIMYITYVNELGSIYLVDELLTLTGWDYNIVINTKNMSAQTFQLR